MKNDLTYNDYTGDSVINRGYEIYDGWKVKTTSSRKIVAEAERAVSAVNTNKSKAASIEALACLFALDMRVKERYSGILQCLFFYFSWRREAFALDMLRSTLRIPEGEKDIRTAIEVALAKLREKIDTEKTDEDDDDTHGGKRNGKSDDEAVTEEKGQEQTAEEKTDELTEAEETEESLEEGTEELAEEKTSSNEKANEEPELAEAEQEEPEAEVQEEVELEPEEESLESEKIELENNGAEESEPSIDTEKNKEVRTYNDAVDSPPLYEETSRSTKTETTSFLDEVIMDNMVKGKADFLTHNPVDDVKQDKEATKASDMAETRDEATKGNAKDQSFLYDKMAMMGNGGQQSPTEKAPEIKTEQKPETKTAPNSNQTQNPEKLDNIKQEFDNMRVPLKVDITNQQEVQMIRELNDTMSIESKLDYIRMQADIFREQIRISNKELGIDENIGVFPIKESDTTTQLSATQNKK